MDTETSTAIKSDLISNKVCNEIQARTGNWMTTILITVKITPIFQCTKPYCTVCWIRNVQNHWFKVKEASILNYLASKISKISFQKKVIFDVSDLTS